MNRSKIHKYKGKTVWVFTYRAIDDKSYNEDINDYEDGFIGTEDEFYDWLDIMTNNYGYGLVTKPKKRHATEEDFREWVLICHPELRQDHCQQNRQDHKK